MFRLCARHSADFRAAEVMDLDSALFVFIEALAV